MSKKIAFVTGGTRGIGRAIVLRLVHEGFVVAFTYHSCNEQAKEVERDATALGGKAVAYFLDIRERENVKRVIDDVEKQWGHIDVLVNNAGIVRDRSLVMMKEEWDDVLQVNLYGTFNVIQRVLISMMKRRRGRVINISSISGVTGIAGQTNYSCSKAGLIGLTRSLAKETASYGVTVNCVAPAGVQTDMIEGVSEKVKQELVNMTPMKRLGRPEEIAKVVAFLANDFLCPTYLNGAIIPIDGGMGVV